VTDIPQDASEADMNIADHASMILYIIAVTAFFVSLAMAWAFYVGRISMGPAMLGCWLGILVTIAAGASGVVALT